MPKHYCKWCNGVNDFAAREWCYCRCQSCGGEKDSEGNCPNYCVDAPNVMKKG